MATAGAGSRAYDRVVVATHADQALALLADPSDEERDLLGAWRYQRNQAVLHTDAAFLPRNRRAWACWNYERQPDPGRGCARLRHLLDESPAGPANRCQYCVTLNPTRPVPPAAVIRHLDYSHPTYNVASMDTQPGCPT